MAYSYAVSLAVSTAPILSVGCSLCRALLIESIFLDLVRLSFVYIFPEEAHETRNEKIEEIRVAKTLKFNQLFRVANRLVLDRVTCTTSIEFYGSKRWKRQQYVGVSSHNYSGFLQREKCHARKTKVLCTSFKSHHCEFNTLLSLKVAKR